MPVNVQTLIDAVIGKEGGYSDHPADRGGATMWGITEQVARAFGYDGDMRALPRAVAVDIYRQRYWTAPRLPLIEPISPVLAAELFDIAVNMGPQRAGTLLQRALNVLNRGATDYPDIAVDGAIGAMTVFALKGFVAKRGAAGQTVLLKTVIVLRGARYVEIGEDNRSQEAFVYGWLANRVALVPRSGGDA